MKRLLLLALCVAIASAVIYPILSSNEAESSFQTEVRSFRVQKEKELAELAYYDLMDAIREADDLDEKVDVNDDALDADALKRSYRNHRHQKLGTFQHRLQLIREGKAGYADYYQKLTGDIVRELFAHCEFLAAKEEMKVYFPGDSSLLNKADETYHVRYERIASSERNLLSLGSLSSHEHPLAERQTKFAALKAEIEKSLPTKQ